MIVTINIGDKTYMITRIGINGFGRIGRVIFRSAQKRTNINIVAINDILDIEHIAYMLKYDSTHGQFIGNIKVYKDYLVVNDQIIHYTSEKNPANLRWKDFLIDVVIESTGMFLTKECAQYHILAGAKKVILTAPPKDNTPMFVMGVNHHNYAGEQVISNASCTTNCLAPIAKIINDHFGIIEGFMTTVHAVTATQKTVDSPISKNWRNGRSAYQNIIPTSTGAAQALGKIIKELDGKLTGMAFRVPVANVSVIDFTIRLKKSAFYQDICNVIKHASENDFKGIVGYTNEKLVSSDFNGEELISIFDANASMSLNDHFVKLISWYDNETGYSNKVIDLSTYIMK